VAQTPNARFFGVKGILIPLFTTCHVWDEATCAVVPLAEVLITGMQPIVDKLTSGKRESIRTNGETVTVSSWRDITPAEEWAVRAASTSHWA
jgi:hypothetical protein